MYNDEQENGSPLTANLSNQAANIFSISVINTVKDISNNSLKNDSVPPTSPWHFIFSPKIPIWKYDDQSYIRINLTREKFSPYYFCHLLLILDYLYYYKFLSDKVFPNDSYHNNIVLYLVTIFSLMTHIAYFVTHFTNPGILPYYWSTTKQRNYDMNELRSGFAINHEQKSWGKNHDWPARSFFSGQYGTIILRADHYCIWINHWIGLKNLKFYIQSLTYCLLFISVKLYAMCKVVKNSEYIKLSELFQIKKINIKILIFVGLFVLLAYFAYAHILNLIYSLYNILINCTGIEILLFRSNRYYDRGIIQNFEEVFGSIYLFPLWFLPIPIPLPTDGFNYPYRQHDYCLASNRTIL